MMEVASHFASTYAGIVGLVIFFFFFVSVALWTFRPGAKTKYQQDAEIPFKE